MLINEQTIEKHIKLNMAKRERGVRRVGEIEMEGVNQRILVEGSDYQLEIEALYP